ncbi:MAG: ATP phosphoribosyltransferase [Bacteroidetes bacterium GWE2_29_8]|nr:MAG: ATP phosphoribosyltransferase [Bacteroidetes bacterium GWE2_29_8]OFY23962.1 MAG: ATP phosphoribosyltransferase [Bacteroidetes bacterium GWF2_29_10]
MEKRIKIAVQKSGRLYEGTIKLLTECGLSISNGHNRLVDRPTNFPIDLLYLRDDDIPKYVEDKIADIGIVGENVVYEKNKTVNIIRKLGFAKCRLSIAIPKTEVYTGLDFLSGKKIATSYSKIVSDFLKEKGINADIHEISGSVEIAPAINLADVIIDLVSTGSTLIGNGLKEVETILNSEAVIISNPLLDENEMSIVNKLLFRIEAVSKSKKYRYLLLNAPESSVNEIINLVPGMKSPTIMPLAKSGWCSMHSVVEEDKFWDVIDNLKLLGAEGILIIPIEKMIL